MPSSNALRTQPARQVLERLSMGEQIENLHVTGLLDLDPLVVSRWLCGEDMRGIYQLVVLHNCVIDGIDLEGRTLYETFEPEEAKRIWDRLEFHYTPKHGSWLNMVEIEIGVLCEQCLADRIPDEDTLRREIAAWETTRNEQQATINWQFTTIDARNKLKRLYPIISKSL